jgi:hypothetical protein
MRAAPCVHHLKIKLQNKVFDPIELNNDVSSTHYAKESPLKDDYKTC